LFVIIAAVMLFRGYTGKNKPVSVRDKGSRRRK